MTDFLANLPGYNLARCKKCGGRIRQWHTDHQPTPSWFHDTVSVDDWPFDFMEWWSHRDKIHDAQPAGKSEVHNGKYYTADPELKRTWQLPCWACGNVPGCEWQDGMGYACCPACRAD